MSEKTSPKRNFTHRCLDCKGHPELSLRDIASHFKGHEIGRITITNCNEHDEPLPCGYCKTLEHFDNCPIYKKYNQCTCLLLEAEANLKCEMHGSVNYVTQEGLVCSECNKLADSPISNTERKPLLYCGFCNNALEFLAEEGTYHCSSQKCEEFVIVYYQKDVRN